MKGKPVLLPLIVALLLSGSTMVAAASYLTSQNQPPAIRAGEARSAHMGGGFAVGWYNPIGGLGEMSSASFRLRSTVGQPVVGDFSSESYHIHMGFWQKFLRGIYDIFLPFVQK